MRLTVRTPSLRFRSWLAASSGAALAASVLLVACGDAADPSDGGAPDSGTSDGGSRPLDGGARVDATVTPDGAVDAGDAGLRADATVADGGADTGAPDAGGDGATGDVQFVQGVVVSTFVGGPTAGGQDGTGTQAQLSNPTGVALDAQGNLYVTENDGSRVRKVTPQGQVTTITAQPGFEGPFAVVVLPGGQIVVQTDYNATGQKNATSGTLWRVTPQADGGTQSATVLATGMGRPRGVVALADGGLFVADRLNQVVSTVSTANGAVTFLAGGALDAGFAEGTGAAARFSSPHGGALLPDGAVVVADTLNHRLRKVTPGGVVTTYAGDGVGATRDGALATARFFFPKDVAIDAAGNLYVVEVGSLRVRRVRTTGVVETLAGNAAVGDAGTAVQDFQDGPGNTARFSALESLDVLPDGKTIYVADGNGGEGTGFHRIRKITVP